MPEKKSETLTLPLLVARSLVVFPGTNEEIAASRPQSAKAISYSLDETNNLLILVSQIDPNVDEIEEKNLYQVGTLVRIVSAKEIPEGGYRIRVIGSKRVAIGNVQNNGEFLLADASIITPFHSHPEEEEDLANQILQEIGSNREFSSHLSRSALTVLAKDGIGTDEIVDTLGPYLPVGIDKKVRLLEVGDVYERLRLFQSFLNLAKEAAELDRKLDAKVRESSEKSQKEYLLRERMKAIRSELGEDGSSESTVDSIREKLKTNPYPQSLIDRVNHELNRLSMMPESSLEASLIMSYIETLLAVPWFEKTEDNEDLDNVRRVLDEDHFGLEKVKKRIIEYLAVKKMTGHLKAPILCFYGPPGCGKTSLARSIARALGRKFFKAALGGISDEAEIRGHRRTYVGAMPGRIIQGMTKAGTINPVFLLDEIDKVGGQNYHGDPSSALLEVLDPEQNIVFNDNYLEEPYDLSNVLFICTANYLENVPAPLRDRLELIEVPSYTEPEKVKIAEGFLVGKQSKLNGLKEGDVIFPEEGIKTLIEHYSMEAGVRQLERLIASCCRKAVVELIDHPDTPRPIVMDTERIHQYLGVELFEGSKKEKEDQVGVVTGLAYTEFGGDILPIEVTYFHGKGTLVLTGKLGEVMRESASIALDYVRANATRYGIDPKIFETNDIHIHVPEGAVPKDGPSAGVAMTIALISCLSGKKVNANVAMTGEVTLRGKALPIGGLREKSLAALRSGITDIIVPNDNKKDVQELPQEVKDGLKIHFMSCVDDAMKIALVEPHE
ncbi:MAG: endopeptidase La [Candidatus Enteromonas sp.]|nr:endopeptidase La [Candidatus Enteromonas sp.]